MLPLREHECRHIRITPYEYAGAEDQKAEETRVPSPQSGRLFAHNWTGEAIGMTAAYLDEGVNHYDRRVGERAIQQDARHTMLVIGEEGGADKCNGEDRECCRKKYARDR